MYIQIQIMDCSLSQIVRIVKVTVRDVHGKIVESIEEINLSKVGVDLTKLEEDVYDQY